MPCPPHGEYQFVQLTHAHPSGRVTRAISSNTAPGSGVCSSMFEQKTPSNVADANGSRRASATPAGGAPATGPANPDSSRSTPVTRAPARARARPK
ncbi:MAG TPA: hypothetical protein VM618_08545 [Acidimicrobiia bacterium]|nr:hypothetical protein [Acidimicrobiia bacterium]